MKKYTIKEFAEGKKAVKIENEEQWNKLNKVHKLTTWFRNSAFYANNCTFWSMAGKIEIESQGWEVLEFSQLDFEDEFVEGWYKNKITKSLYRNILRNEVIWSSHRFEKDYDVKENFSDWELLKDLSEIQPFLPLNHPDLMKKDTFVLPEKWYLNHENAGECLDFINTKCTYDYKPYINSHYPHFEGLKFINGYADPHKNYTEITFEQFKTHILKESTMKKEIIEYRVIKKYYNLAKSLFTECKPDNKGGYGRFDFDSNVKDFFKEAGVLDLWFEPVCKEEFKKDDYVTVVSTSTYDYDSSSGDTRPVIGKTYKIYNVNTNYVNLDVPGGRIAIKSSDLRKATEDEIKKAQIQLPTIKGYNGKIEGDFIVYGCAKFSKEFFEDLAKVDYSGNRTIDFIQLSSGVKITMKEIEQVAEFINNK